jgi:DNA invertase Pin-like site-specific DNA recombinase
MNSSPKRVAIYARVSTGQQSAEMQLRDLRRFAEQRGFQIEKEFVDEGFSGSRDSRPGLNALMEACRKRHYDAVLVWRFDRWARSTKHLIETLMEFKSLGVEFLSYQENLDTGSPMGQAMFTIIAALGQLERDIIIQRVKSGLENARAKGKRLGRPKVRDDAQIRLMRAQGLSIRRIAKQVGLSTTAVQRALKGSVTITVQKKDL